jgi:hypothetical protein
MAHYVLLAFADDAAAKTFVRDVLEYNHIDSMVPTFVDNFAGVEKHEAEVTLHGVWRKPTQFCHCNRNPRQGGFQRGKKYGWWVCAVCGKPHELSSRGAEWWVALGTNLLPEPLRPPGQYNHKSWQSAMEWTFLLKCSACGQPMDTPGCSRNSETDEAFHTVSDGVTAVAQG